MAAKKKKQIVVSRTTGYIIIGFFVLVAVGTVIKSNDPKEQARTSMISVRDACRESLLKTLTDPGSAKLDGDQQWHVEQQQDGTFLVQPTGQAKNASGGYMDGTWDCVVQKNGMAINVVSVKLKSESQGKP